MFISLLTKETEHVSGQTNPLIFFVCVCVVMFIGWCLYLVHSLGLGLPCGEDNGTPCQYSFLENPMDGGAC